MDDTSVDATTTEDPVAGDALGNLVLDSSGLDGSALDGPGLDGSGLDGSGLDGMDLMGPADLLAAVNASAGALAHSMGIAFREVSVDRLVATMPVEGNTQPYGLLHGGASAVLAESLGSTGAALHAGQDRVAIGVDLNITHHRTIRDGVLTAVATPLHLGRNLASYQVAVQDDTGRRIASARLTSMLRDNS